MLDIYQINPFLIGLLGQETFTDFEFKNLSSKIEKSSTNRLKEIISIIFEIEIRVSQILILFSKFFL